MQPFYDHELNSANGNWGNITFPLFRLGEIYLNFIEAVLECKRNGVSLPAGYENEAFAKWDDLRDRSGMAPIREVYKNADINQLVDLCRKERRVELAFESHRYFDTRTWMIAEETDGGPMYGMDTTCPGSGSVTPQGFWNVQCSKHACSRATIIYIRSLSANWTGTDYLYKLWLVM